MMMMLLLHTMPLSHCGTRPSTLGGPLCRAAVAPWQEPNISLSASFASIPSPGTQKTATHGEMEPCRPTPRNSPRKNGYLCMLQIVGSISPGLHSNSYILSFLLLPAHEQCQTGGHLGEA